MKRKITARKIENKANQEYQASVGTGTWLNRAVSFNHNLSLNYQDRQNVKILMAHIGIKPRTENTTATEIIIANLLSAKVIIIPFLQSEWKQSPYTKAGPCSRNIITKMEKKGLIKMKKGYHFENNSRRSRIWAEEDSPLLHYFPKFPNQVLIKPVNLVVLKDEDGNLKPYEETAETKRIKKVLTQANKVNEQAIIRYGKYILHGHLVAKFKRKFTLYGRLHTMGCRHYQGYSEDERATFTINGNPVVELDFKGLHPNLLYAEEGLQSWQDPYSIILDDPDIEIRKTLRKGLKQALLALINGKGKYTTPKKKGRGHKKQWLSAETIAQKAIHHVIWYDKATYAKCKEKGWEITPTKRLKMKEAARLRAALAAKGITEAKQLIDAFKQAHPKIAHRFCTGDVGMKLMNKDSKIALDIIEHFTSQGIPILCVHDSFIVQAQHRNELKKVMKQTYKKHTNGFRIGVD